MRKRLISRTSIVTVCIIGLFMAGCASFTKNTYRALSVAKETREVGLSSMGDLYRQGKITEEQKDEIIKVGNEYRDAYLIAVDALVAYVTTEKAEDKTKLQTAMREFSTVSIKLTQLLQKYVK